MAAEPRPVCVRRLSIADARAVASLIVQLGYPADALRARERIENWSRDARAAALGAELEGRLVGCAAICLVPFFERDGSRARLVALVVDSGHRGRGIGAALVQRARQFALDHGAVEIEVTARTGREQAQRFYAGAGFEDVTGRSRRYISALAEDPSRR